MSNTISLVGRLVADCRTGRAGDTPVCNFKVANDVGYGEKKHTNFIECALWGKRAEGGVTEYLVKGQQVYITGELTLKDPRENNGKHYNDATIRVNDLELVGGKKEGGQSDKPSTKVPQQPDDLSDDIPFVTRDGIR